MKLRPANGKDVIPEIEKMNRPSLPFELRLTPLSLPSHSCCMLHRFLQPIRLFRTSNAFSAVACRSFSSTPTTTMALSTFSVDCTSDELKDGQMKEVEIGEGERKGKILLSKVKGVVYATSSQVRSPSIVAPLDARGTC